MLDWTRGVLAPDQLDFLRRLPPGGRMTTPVGRGDVVLGYALARHVPLQQLVPLGPERDHAHVGGVALVARAGVCNVEQANSHASTSSTLVDTTLLSIRAGQ